MNKHLLNYYEAIEQASADMVSAARSGNWDQVVKLEGACVLLISELKQAAQRGGLSDAQMQTKARLMQRILLNDAEIRLLAEPWLQDLEQTLAGRTTQVH